jgi:hypothetical protein
MLLIARYQTILLCRIGTFQKYVVIGIARHLEPARRTHHVAVPFDEFHQLLQQPIANP